MKISMKKTALFSIFLSSVLMLSGNISAAEADEDDCGGDGETIEVSDAFVRLVPKESKVTAAFMKLSSYFDDDVKLVKASSPVFKHTELHLSTNKDGMHKMVEVESMEIPAYDELLLKPGSYHIMLFHPQIELIEGKFIPIKLKFVKSSVEDHTKKAGYEIDIQAQVKPIKKPMMNKHHMENSEMKKGSMHKHHMH